MLTTMMVVVVAVALVAAMAYLAGIAVTLLVSCTYHVTVDIAVVPVSSITCIAV